MIRTVKLPVLVFCHLLYRTSLKTLHKYQTKLAISLILTSAKVELYLVRKYTTYNPYIRTMFQEICTTLQICEINQPFLIRSVLNKIQSKFLNYFKRYDGATSKYYWFHSIKNSSCIKRQCSEKYVLTVLAWSGISHTGLFMT